MKEKGYSCSNPVCVCASHEDEINGGQDIRVNQMVARFAKVEKSTPFCGSFGYHMGAGLRSW